MSRSPFADLLAPSIELWQNQAGSWAWVIIDRPDLNEPGIVIFDSTRHSTPQAALSDVYQVIARDNWRRGP